MIKLKKPTQMTTRRPIVYCKNWLPMVEASVMMLFSGGGVGKSFAAIKVATEFCKDTGHKAALWLTEDPEGENRDRYERIIAEYDKPREYFDSRIVFVDEQPRKFSKLRDGNAELTEDFWEARLSLFEYALVVLDPLLQFQGGDENSNTHAGVLMGAMKDWAAEENKIVFLLHHASKTDYGLKARGAGEWVNSTRGCYEIAKVKKEDGSDDEKQKDSRIFTLKKDNGLSYYFTNQHTDKPERLLRVFPPRPEEQEEEQKPGYVRMSFADHNSEKNPRGFESVLAPFDALHLWVKENRCYSPYSFAGGHRKNENNLGFSDVLCLDFDGGMTLAEAEKKFSKTQALIITTRSHQKEGKGDRFRVIIKLKTRLNIPPEDHREFMDALFDSIGSVDPATKDMARFFFASPPDAFHFYTGSKDPFNWELIYNKIKKEKVFNAINEKRNAKTPGRKTAQGPQSNTLPKDTSFTTKRGGFSTMATMRESMSYGEKQPVQCRHGHGHNGGAGPEHNAAAFVCKADNGNVFYHCSGGKCASEGVLWCED